MEQEISAEIREAADRFVTLIRAIPQYSDLRYEALALVLGEFCRYCGCDNPRCQCWNDE